MIENNQCASYIFHSVNELKRYSAYQPVWLDVAESIDEIADYHVEFGAGDIDKAEFIKDTGDDYKFCAVYDGKKIVALGAAIKMGLNNMEIGAISTLPLYRNKGISKSICCFIADFILTQGKTATLNTGIDNVAMKKVAEQIGMSRK